MSVTVAFDVYPAATPNGTLLVRLLTSGTGTKQSVELACRKVLHGSGEGMIRIHSDHAAATSANFAKRNYVKVVLINGATETPFFGFFMEQGDFAAVDRSERGGRMLTFSGPGSFFYLDRAVLLESFYAPGQPARGSFNIDGQWTWSDRPYGAIMTRALEEGQNAPGTPLADASWDFDRVLDSAGNPWANIDNEYQVPWGLKVYDLIANFIKLGLTVTVDPDLTFHGWNSYGTNRTSATFAANKIRFAHGVNIGNEVTREIRASLERSHMFVTGDDFETVVVSGGSSAVTYYDTLQRQDTNDPATLTAAGGHNLDAREIQADAAFPVRVIIADDELNGMYVPGEHYDVGDIATIHTVPPGAAASPHDYVNFAIEVAAIKLEHDDAGNWFAVNELGAQYLVSQMSAFEERSNRVIHQLELCRPLVTVEPTFVVAASNSEGAAGPGSMTVPSGLTNSAMFIAVPGVLPQTFPPTTVSWNAVAATLYDSITHGTQGGIALYYILSPSPGQAMLDTSNGNGVLGAWLYEGVNQTSPISAWAEATGTSATAAATVGDPGGASAIAAMTVDDDDFVSDTPVAPVAGAGMTSDWASAVQAGTPGFRDMQYAGGHGDWSASWTLNESHPWSAFVAGVAGIGVSGAGDGHASLIGTSIRAKRCDDTEHYHAAGNPTVNDDTTLGFRNGTMWINETTGAMYLLLDNTDGAANWLAIGGGTDLSGINFLVGTASGDLSAEIVVGTTPGGELGNTWASPTVDATHAGSNHLQPVRKNSAGTVFERRRLNLIEGSNVTLTVADDAGNDEVDITIAATSGVTALNDLTDVTITSPATAERLRYDGSQWVNSALKWSPTTTFDGTNWVLVTDGSGNPVLTEV